MVKLGLDSFSYNLHMENPQKPLDVFWFLNRVVELGLDGCQVDPRHLGDWKADLMNGIGQFCSDNGLYLELGTWRYDFDTVSMQLQRASEAGARCLRTFYGGFRHETSAHDLRKAMSDTTEGLKRLAPVAEDAGVPLALENHEEFTSEEIVEILEAVGSPYVRACLDTGNGMPVGEDPVDCVRNLAPYAAATHLKDWVVRFEDGVPSWEDRALGEGEAKTAQVYAILRHKLPDLPLTIELPTFGSSRQVTIEDEERNVVKSVEFARGLESRSD